MKEFNELQKFYTTYYKTANDVNPATAAINAKWRG
jgi:hypothetical protein